MSWNSYINSVIGFCKGACDKSCIISINGSIWTSSPGDPTFVHISVEEAEKIAANLRDEKWQDFQVNGVIVEGVKYQYLRENGNVVYAKKKGQGCLTLQKTKTSVVIAHTEEGKQHGDTNDGVTKICDYLESMDM